MTVYTAVFSDYDTLHPLPEGVHGVCFTDSKANARGWELRPAWFKDDDPRMRARHHKCMSHVLFPGETTLWIDGNIHVTSLPPEREFATFHHKMGVKGINAEIKECLRHGKFKGDEERIALDRLAEWESEGFTDNHGHPETCVLMRGPGVAAFNELWWELVSQVRRDQTSCDYAAWKTGLKWEPWDGTVVKNGYVRQVKHEPDVQAVKERIYYFTPYDKRGIGVAYNECCKIVPDGAWACLMDADMMLFPADFGDIIQETIAKRPDIDVWTTMVTRVNCAKTLVCPEGKMDEERDITALRAKAVVWSAQNRGKVKEIKTPWLAGYFLLFRKSLWKEFPFPEKIEKSCFGGARGNTVLGIDTHWSNMCHKAGKKFAAIEGLLAIHYYTLGVSRQAHLRLLETNGRMQPKPVVGANNSGFNAGLFRRKALTNKQAIG